MIPRMPIRRFHIVLLLLFLVILIMLNFHHRLPESKTKRDIGKEYHWTIQHGKNIYNKPLRFFNKLWWPGNDQTKLIQNKMDVAPSAKAGEVIPMYVLEEHHGVIPYWFEAVEKGILPHRTGNTLIHIDAHSDFANPEIGSSFPLFRWPKRHEWPLLMQQNDMFIVAAALTGMFSRLVWVYPDWDVGLDAEFHSEHVIINVTVGTKILKKDSLPFDPKTQGRVCACLTYLNQPIKNTNKTTVSDGNECYALTNISTSDDDQQPIPKSSCRLLDKSARLEAIRESKLVELLQRKDSSFQPIQPTAGWILDMDEDYFGVEAPAVPLYNSKMTDDWIDTLSGWVSGIFCAKTAAEELAGDLVFQRLINYIRVGDKKGNTNECLKLRKLIALKLNESEDLLSPLYGSETIGVHLRMTCARLVLKLITTTSRNELSHSKKSTEISPKKVFCPHDDEELERTVFMGELLAMLYAMNDQQLKALVKVGICMWSSIPSREMPGKMRVCDGFNRPNNDSAVDFHTPTVKEIRAQSKRLGKILQGLSESSSWFEKKAEPGPNPILVAPHLITLARSARDGYVPRSLLGRIEKSIVMHSRDVFEKVKPLTLVYDSNLLGGLAGWNKRPKETSTNE